MEKSGNPALRQSALDRLAVLEQTDRATISGTTTKVIILLLLAILGGFSGWRMLASGSDLLWPLLIISVIGAPLLALITIFLPKISPFSAPIYALLEGVLLGAISQGLNSEYNGIALQAILLTSAVFVVMLALYSSRVVRVTDKLRSTIIIATAAIALYYLIVLIASFFGSRLPLIYDSGLYGIIFSLIVVLVAALNLLLDFNFIEKTAENNAPKVFEWYGAFSLMITLVWLYLEILRLLSKMRD